MRPMERADIYGGADPGDAPAYTVTEAAPYLSVPRATLSCWFFGQDYSAGSERKRSRAVILPADGARRMLSFRNLVEGHILSSLRTVHQIPLPKIRKAMCFLRKHTAADRPL